MKIKHPSLLYWIIDLFLTLEFFYLVFFRLSEVQEMVGIPLVALGLTLLHQFYDENEYFKGMYGNGPLGGGKNIAGLWQKIIRWLLTIVSFVMLYFLFSS